MFYLYLGSVVLSYIITKHSIDNLNKDLTKRNLKAFEYDDEKIEKFLFILIISLIPIFNLVISISTIFSNDWLYNSFKYAKCEQIIKDNKKLLEKYRRICDSNNEIVRRYIEKEIIKAKHLIISGVNEEEILENIRRKVAYKFKY